MRSESHCTPSDMTGNNFTVRLVALCCCRTQLDLSVVDLRLLLHDGSFVDERIFLVGYVFREGDKCHDVMKLKFSKKFPDSIIPHRNAVRTVIEKFRVTGSVEDVERSGRPHKLDEQKLLDF
ncbi:hypothetical protein J6590_056916 [Homalodisca vitripennis]|nr:hypothetical protein J6590_056916 [Homalodisca vitripennis]